MATEIVKCFMCQCDLVVEEGDEASHTEVYVCPHCNSMIDAVLAQDDPDMTMH